MAEYVDRDKLLHIFSRDRWTKYDPAEVRTLICFVKTEDVRPVVRGKWIDRDDKYYGWNMWSCSACGEEFVLAEGTPDMNEYHFCPNCGADLRECET